MIDGGWEIDWEACPLSFSFIPCLPLSTASCVFMPFLLTDQAQPWPAVLGFQKHLAERWALVKNSCGTNNHLERSIEWVASGFLVLFRFFSSSHYACAVASYIQNVPSEILADVYLTLVWKWKSCATAMWLLLDPATSCWLTGSFGSLFPLCTVYICIYICFWITFAHRFSKIIALS